MAARKKKKIQRASSFSAFHTCYMGHLSLWIWPHWDVGVALDTAPPSSYIFFSYPPLLFTTKAWLTDFWHALDIFCCLPSVTQIFFDHQGPLFFTVSTEGGVWGWLWELFCTTFFLWSMSFITASPFPSPGPRGSHPNFFFLLLGGGRISLDHFFIIFLFNFQTLYMYDLSWRMPIHILLHMSCTTSTKDYRCKKLPLQKQHRQKKIDQQLYFHRAPHIPACRGRGMNIIL